MITSTENTLFEWTIKDWPCLFLVGKTLDFCAWNSCIFDPFCRSDQRTCRNMFFDVFFFLGQYLREAMFALVKVWPCMTPSGVSPAPLILAKNPMCLCRNWHSPNLKSWHLKSTKSEDFLGDPPGCLAHCLGSGTSLRCWWSNMAPPLCGWVKSVVFVGKILESRSPSHPAARLC